MSWELQETIAKAVEACQQQKAEEFAALFTLDGELILTGGQTISGREAIARASADYFAICEEIHIEIEEIRIDGDRAFVQWIWYSVERRTGKQKYVENIIKLYFRSKAIACWQEEKK